MNGWWGRPTIQAVTFTDTVEGRIQTVVANGRYRSTAMARVSALPHGGSEPELFDAARCLNWRNVP
jgi:hypothetical protein